MRLALLQINPTAGDLEGNASPIVRAARARRKCSGADLVVTPELALTGYLPRDPRPRHPGSIRPAKVSAVG